MDYNLNFFDIYESNNKMIEKINIDKYTKIHRTYNIRNKFIKNNEKYCNSPNINKNIFLVGKIIFEENNYMSYNDNLQYYNIIIRNNNKYNKLFFDYTGTQNNNHILQIDSKTNLFIFNINQNLINDFLLYYDINKYNIDIDIDIYHKKNYNTFFNTYALIAGYLYSENNINCIQSCKINLLYDILDCVSVNKNYIDIQTFIIKIHDKNINIVINKTISYKNFEINIKLFEINQFNIIIKNNIINKNIITSIDFYNIMLFIINYFINKYKISKDLVICHLLYNKIDFDKINTYMNFINDINDKLSNNI